MALPKFTIYKHVKLGSGWRYCKAAFHSNGKIKPNIVVVNRVEENHREGAYYLNHNRMWIPVGEDAKEAANERLKRLNAAQYQRLNGITAPELRKTPLAIPLQMAIDDYLRHLHASQFRVCPIDYSGEWHETQRVAVSQRFPWILSGTFRNTRL